MEETGSIPTVRRAVVVHRLRPRWPLGTLWARSGHEAPSRIVYRKPTYHLTRRFIGSGQAYRSQHANACTHGSRNGPSSGLLWARWNRTIGLRIIRAGQRAGQPIGITSDLPLRATGSRQKTARATSFGHALGTAAALADIIGPPPQRVLSALATLLPNDFAS